MKTKIHNFNLVEIIIAMGIVVICITTIVGLLSAGMKMSEDAVEKSYTNNIIEQIGGMIETYPGAEDKVPTSEPYTTATAAATISAAENACSTAIDADDPFFKNVYWNNSSMGTLKITYKTTINSASVPDFTCYAKLWYDTDSTKPVPVTDGSTINLDTDILYIELTWPYKMPYGDRVLSGNIITFQKVLRQ